MYIYKADIYNHSDVVNRINHTVVGCMEIKYPLKDTTGNFKKVRKIKAEKSSEYKI